MILNIAALSSFFRTISTTNNFWTAILFRYSSRKKHITFRDKTTFYLKYSQYWKVRDVYSAGYRIKQITNDLFKVKKNDLVLLGSSDMLRSICELSCGYYNWNCQGKIVLDIGGFQGVSAVHFSRMGAKKIVLYEPVKSHHKVIKRNMLLNHVNAELHEEGIGNKDGFETIHYESADVGFGITSKGSHEMQIKIRNIAKVIEDSQAEIAKFNCEGGEVSLLGLSLEILGKIDVYIIMAHNPKISKALINKFLRSNFSLIKQNNDQSFLCFKKKKSNLQ